MSKNAFLIKNPHSDNVSGNMEGRRASAKSRFRPWLLASLLAACLSVLHSYSTGSLHNFLDGMFPRIPDPDEDLDMVS